MKTDKELRLTLGGITTEAMAGDNLAITLCVAFDDPVEPINDDYGWGKSAVDGTNATLDLIHNHYLPTLTELRAKNDYSGATLSALLNRLLEVSNESTGSNDADKFIDELLFIIGQTK